MKQLRRAGVCQDKIFPENYQGQVERPLLSTASQARCSTRLDCVVLDNIKQFIQGLIVIKKLLFYLD